LLQRHAQWASEMYDVHQYGKYTYLHTGTIHYLSMPSRIFIMLLRKQS